VVPRRIENAKAPFMGKGRSVQNRKKSPKIEKKEAATILNTLAKSY
jgi:hypothetical protein